MSNITSNNKRLAKNTIFMYFRMVFLMGIGLYASRVILQTLGISDYGLYNVVGGVVALFGFLNSTLSTSTQRFLNVEIGKGNPETIKKVFANALFLHILLMVIILLLAETIGLWFVKNKLVIPEGRELAAMWVYQFSVVAVCIQIAQLPFMSAIIAHERMNVYAYVSIYEGLAKLAILFILQTLNYDKLVLYGVLVLIVQISVALLYNTYSRRNFTEAAFRISKDKTLFNEMISFSSWNVVGCLAFVCNSQGLNIVLNLFFGTVVNAARGIAFQVNGLTHQLVSNFQLAVKPQIIKYYASGQQAEMVNLVFNAAKYSAFLMIIANVPVILEIRPLLHIWLGDFPDYTPVFVSLVLFRAIITSMTGIITMVVHATGYMKKVGLFSGGSLLLVLPISYLLLLIGCPPIIPFIVNIVAAFADAFFELYWMRRYINFPMTLFYKKVYARVFGILFISFSVSFIIHNCISHTNDFVRLLVVVPLSCIASSLIILYCGIDKKMRTQIVTKIKTKVKKN